MENINHAVMYPISNVKNQQNPRSLSIRNSASKLQPSQKAQTGTNARFNASETLMPL